MSPNCRVLSRVVEIVFKEYCSPDASDMSGEQFMKRRLVERHSLNFLLQVFSRKMTNKWINRLIVSFRKEKMCRVTCSSPLSRLITWIKMCANVNHRKKEVEPYRLIPRKDATNQNRRRKVFNGGFTFVQGTWNCKSWQKRNWSTVFIFSFGGLSTPWRRDCNKPRAFSCHS